MAGNSGCVACVGCVGFVLFFVSILLFALSWDTLHPTEYGLVRNGITGAVNLNDVYQGGRYFLFLRHEFIRFPNKLMTLSYGDAETDDYGVILARTGPGEEDDESGGQPITLALSFQYRIAKENVSAVYQSFEKNYEASFLRFANEAITVRAQKYTPRQFWEDRKAIQNDFLVAVDQELYAKGNVQVVSLQLRKVDFQANYEETITNIQLQSQYKVTKNFGLQVTSVLKEVDILQSETAAKIALINAEADRTASVMINKANANALKMEQDTKAQMYAQLRQAMNWTAPQFLEYVRIKALNSQPTDNVLVGTSAVGLATPMST